MFTLYVVTNLANGKYYVGQTNKTGAERWKDHCWGANKRDYFHYAISKHGKQNFVVEDIATFETREEVSQAEKLWILATGSYDRTIGYNSTFGGEYGAIPNEETRAKIGAFSSTRVHSPETRQKMSESHSGDKNHFFGKKHDPDTIQAMIEKLKVSHSGEGNYWFGKTFSPEHRANLSAVRKGVKKTKPVSEETRRKLSELAAARWEQRKSNPSSTRSIGKPKRIA